MKESLRTLHINTERTWRGGEQQTLNLVRGLRARGHFALLIAQSGGMLAKRAISEGLQTQEMSMRCEADPFAVAKLVRAIHENEVDLVHMHTSHAHLLGCLATVFARKGLDGFRLKTVVSRRVDFSIAKTPISIYKYKHGVDRYISISEAIKRVLVQDGVEAERISIVPSGVDIARFNEKPSLDLRAEFGLAPNSVLVGNVAHMADHKGQKYLVEAIPLILKEFPRTIFFIVGDGELRGDLEQRRNQLGIQNQLIFTGFREDVPDILRNLDLFVMPSHMEGLGTIVMDAMAAGVPVVATTAGGIPEIIEHETDGLLVEPRNSKALAAAIIQLLADRRLAARLAQTARQKVTEKFSADRMVEGTLDVYRSLFRGLS